MHHAGTQPMETDRLMLRRFAPQDAQAAFDNWMGDEKVTPFLRWPAHQSVEVTKGVLADWIQSYQNADFYQWAIVLKELGAPIGTISVVDQNERLSMVHIGYCIGSRWWNRGIVTEAFSAVIPFLFRVVQANRIESQHDPCNPGSGRVMEKCGLKYEGTLRQADFSNRGIVDAAMYSLLKSEYREGEA